MKKRGESSENVVRIAISLAGGMSECARKMSVTKQALSKWQLEEDRRPGAFADRSYQIVMTLADASGVAPSKLTGIPDFVRGGVGGTKKPQ